MPEQSNNPFRFWQELKRRKVIRVIPVYAAAAFVLLELVDIITEPFGLPDWTLKLVVVLLFIGFVIAVILSWVYDITPEGVQKTKSVSEVVSDKVPEKPSKIIGWRITTYVSVVVIIGLLMVNIFGVRKHAEVDTELEKSIAVLPFYNFSEDTEQNFMCLGLTDEIINHLYKIASFDKVVSLTSVLNYRDPERNISEIANELGVNYILEGTYKKIGEDVRVHAQLIEPGSDRHIWIHEYDRPYEEIIAIQSDIALQIADHVKAFLTVSEKQNILKIPTTNQEAYELMQKASLLITDELNTLDQGLDLCLQAIELDPDYADAYATAGTCIILKGCYGGGSEMQSVVWDATRYLEKALELDQSNGYAHFGLAWFYDWIRWDYIKAEAEYLKAIELEPNNLHHSVFYDEFLIKRNRLDDALSYLDTTRSTMPIKFLELLTRIQVLSGNEKQAYVFLNTYLKSYGDLKPPQLGESYIWLEEYDSAKIYLESAMQSEVTNSYILIPRFQACLALAYEKTNNHQEARKIINQLIAKSDETSAGSPAYFTGWYYSGIGKVDSALYWLEKAYQNRSPEMPWLKVDPGFKNLKNDDRYWDLYERTGHKAYDEYMINIEN